MQTFSVTVQVVWEGEAPAEPKSRLGGSLALPDIDYIWILLRLDLNGYVYPNPLRH